VGWGSPPTMTIQLARTPKKAKPSAEARFSAAKKRGFGLVPRLRQSISNARRRRPNRAQRPCRAQRSSGSRPTTAQHSTPTRRRKPRAAARPSAVEKGESGVSPTTTIQLARTPKKAMPSTAAMPRAAEKGDLEISPDCTRKHAHSQKKAKRSGEAERSGKRGFEGFPLTVALQIAHAPRSQAQRPRRAQ
jgi:hypothetical protein